MGLASCACTRCARVAPPPSGRCQVPPSAAADSTVTRAPPGQSSIAKSSTYALSQSACAQQRPRACTYVRTYTYACLCARAELGHVDGPGSVRVAWHAQAVAPVRGVRVATGHTHATLVVTGISGQHVQRERGAAAHATGWRAVEPVSSSQGQERPQERGHARLRGAQPSEPGGGGSTGAAGGAVVRHVHPALLPWLPRAQQAPAALPVPAHHAVAGRHRAGVRAVPGLAERAGRAAWLRGAPAAVAGGQCQDAQAGDGLRAPEQGGSASWVDGVGRVRVATQQPCPHGS